MKRWLFLPGSLLAAGLLLAACRGLGGANLPFQSPQAGGGTPAASLAPAADPANGEQIYFTAADKDGNRLRYTGGPDFGGMMMGAYLTCAACHGPDAHGGQHVMHMQIMDAPPVYYAALTSMLAEESGGTQEPGGYTLDDFRKSVVDGQHPDGDRLDNDMPRWQISDRDLADLFAFLKTIPQ
jgi:mono/diheme cytochrome c family protein